MKLQQSMAAMIVASSLILGLSAPRTLAAVRYVWQESPNPAPPYTNWATAAHVIQEAVDSLETGGTMMVTNGTYSAGGAFEGRVVLRLPIVLRSVNGPAVTAIDGGGTNRCVYLGTRCLSGSH